MRLLRKLRVRYSKVPTNVEAPGLDRREFLTRMVSGAALVTTSWLATDVLYENYGGNALEESWLNDYYKSDFVGV